MVRRGDSTDDEPSPGQSQSSAGPSQHASTSRVKAERGSPRGAKRARVNEAGDDAVHDNGQQDEEEEDDDQQQEEQGDEEAPTRVMAKTLPRDVDGYIPGSIKRIKLHNFVTYDDVEFHPGPHLNMILGPNGTGKSSIACAICLGLNWSPAILGRAADLPSFVKLGADTGFIEIELKGKKGEDNLVIRRNINAKSKASNFTISGTSATGAEVTARVSALNVQVGNLCSFLPQDKVSSFAAMSPVALLRETENAAGDDRLGQWHDALIEDGKKLKAVSEGVAKDTAQMNQLQERNNQIEREVQRYKERKEIELRIHILRILLPVERYRESRIKWMELKAKKQVYYQRAMRLKDKNQPAHDYLDALEKEYQSLNEQRDKFKRAVHSGVEKLKTAKKQAAEKETDCEKHTNALDNVKKTEENRLKQIKNAEKQIESIENEMGKDVKPHTQEEENDLRDQMRAIRTAFQQTSFDDDERAWQRRRQDNEEKKRKAKRNEDMAKENLRGLNSLAGRKLENFARWDPAGGEAVRWLRNNKQLFRMEVFEPPALSVSVSDPSFAHAVESCFGGAAMRMFVCQCQEDYNTLNKSLNDNPTFTQNGRRRIPTWYRPGAERGDVPGPPVPHEQLAALGFEGYALDYIECPDGLRWYLQKDLNLQRIPITRRSISPNDIPRVTDALLRGAGGGVNFVEGQNQHQALRSRYGQREVMNSTTGIRQARNFAGNLQVDQTQKQNLEQQIKASQQELVLAEEEDDELAQIRKGLDARQKEHNEELRELNNQLDEIKRAMQKRLGLEQRLKRNQELLAKAQKQGNAVEAAAKIRRALFKAASERKTLLAKYLAIAKDVVEAQKKAALAGLEFLQVGANKTAFKELLDVKDAKYLAALNEFNEIDEEVKRVRQLAVQLQSESQAALDNISDQIRPTYLDVEAARVAYAQAVKDAGDDADDVPEPEVMPEIVTRLTSDALEAELDVQTEKLEMNMHTNPGVVEQYERRKHEIEGLQTTIEAKERDVKKLERNIKRARDNWEPKLRELVASIGKKFSAAFDRIGCAGEIRIREDEAYELWAIDILVKFRDTEKLQLLTAHRQSGGERSLTTILYLMSLTEQARAPFSLVDEINQGMDQRAERMVHNSMVEVTCKEDAAQYFLITPKLLSDLDYHDRMKTLCVLNGEWLPEEQTSGNLMSMIDAYAAKNGL
ncbi:Purine nucleoside phosphorylase [Mycena chlorophos]|uniref:Structural maintenance of chromosomes protein 5 n=1 Tax=Mycena chlorophos TaxID=658473 RepID=A0A8H6TE54_MYCCL|nr:Purine nucleoside phosphorylase [Mycena chlorophos]